MTPDEAAHAIHTMIHTPPGTASVWIWNGEPVSIRVLVTPTYYWQVKRHLPDTIGGIKVEIEQSEGFVAYA